MNKLIFFMALSALPVLQSAQASSAFTSNSSVTITIDSITNNTAPGDLSGLDIYGLFEFDDSGSAQVITGDGSSSYGYIGSEIDTWVAPVNDGDSIAQTFSSIGGANNGSVEAYYQAFGELGFVNNTSDSFTIEYTLRYDLNADSSGDFANNTVALEYFDEIVDSDYNFIASNIYGYQEASADASFGLSDQNSSLPGGISFNLNIGADQIGTFYADVSINGYAEASPVPLPAAGWLMLSGLVFLRRYRTVKV